MEPIIDMVGSYIPSFYLVWAISSNLSRGATDQGWNITEFSRFIMQLLVLLRLCFGIKK